jgi:hypothetical protein
MEKKRCSTICLSHRSPRPVLRGTKWKKSIGHRLVVIVEGWMETSQMPRLQGNSFCGAITVTSNNNRK